MLTPYPENLTEAAAVVISKLRGKDVDLAHAVHAGWNIVGFALSQTLPCDDATPEPVQALGSGNAFALADALECKCAARVGADPAPVGMGWEQIVTILLPILLDWWRSRK